MINAPFLLNFRKLKKTKNANNRVSTKNDKSGSMNRNKTQKKCNRIKRREANATFDFITFFRAETSPEPCHLSLKTKAFIVFG
jgi:hypothetical protein